MLALPGHPRPGSLCPLIAPSQPFPTTSQVSGENLALGELEAEFRSHCSAVQPRRRGYRAFVSLCFFV